MAKLNLPTSDYVDGPWLLTVNDLQSLHNVLESIDQKIGEAAEKQTLDEAQKDVADNKYPTLEEALAFRTRYYTTLGNKWGKKTKEITLSSEDGRSLFSESLAELIRDRHIRDFTPSELKVEIRQNTNQFWLTLKRRKEGGLYYNTTCFEQSYQNDIFYEIENWVDARRSSRVLQKWLDLGPLLGMLMMLAAAFFFAYSIRHYNYSAMHLESLHELLNSGITKENEPKALELFLKYQTNHPIVIEAGKPGLSGDELFLDYFWLRLAAVATVASIFLFNPPRTTIGIGRHKNLVGKYNAYIKFVFVTIPTTFILTPLYTFIKHLLGM